MNFKKIILIAGSVLMIALLLMSVDSRLDITGGVISQISKSNSSELTPNQISNKLDSSLTDLELKNQELERLGQSVSEYKENLEQILDSYNSLGSDIMSSVQNANQIADRVKRTQQETEDVRKELSSIKEAIEIGQIGNNFNYTKNEGSSKLFTFFGILTLVNSGLFIFSIFYLRKNKNHF